MSRIEPFETQALLAMAVGATAALTTGALTVPIWMVAMAALFLAWGRRPGWTLTRAAYQPMLFQWLAAAYAVVFAFDLVYSVRENPVPALVRLLVFILIAEAFAGNGKNVYRAVLLGFLLLIAAAAETTDVWFLLPLVLFACFAGAAMWKVSLGLGSEESGRRMSPSFGVASGLVFGSAATAIVFFFVVPHAGTGGPNAGRSSGSNEDISVGLSEGVDLGSIGKVKKERRVAMRVRFDKELEKSTELYWRAAAYDRWNGSGWDWNRQSGVSIHLPPHRRVVLKRDGASDSAGRPAIREKIGAIIAEVRLVRKDLPALPLPATARWIESSKAVRVSYRSDGAIVPARRALPQRLVVGLDPSLRVFAGDSARPVHRETGYLDQSVKAWAAGIRSRGESDKELAEAFIEDLIKRKYSLDTRGIDARRPLASFLEGAPGHCEFFASAMALGLRYRGVPARVVSGYFGADAVPLGDEYVVRDSRAHLWVEAFIDGAGWMRFDPTPPAGRGVQTTDWFSPRRALEWGTMIWDYWIIGLDMNDQVNLLAAIQDFVVSVLRRAWPVLLIVALLLFVHRRFRRQSKIINQHGRIPSFYRRFLKAAERKGVRIGESETHREFAERAGRAMGDVQAARRIAAAYEHQRFGGFSPTSTDREKVRESLARLASS